MEAHYQENSHSVEGGEEQHEKKTVMNKVKDKARRMKNTFNKMAHGHNANDDHRHEHDNDAKSEVEEVYEEEEEEEVREAGTEVHAAPMYESEAAGHFASERGENLGQVKEVNFGEAVATTAVDQGPSGPKVTAASDESRLLYPSTTTVNESEAAGHFAGERGEDLGPGKDVNFVEVVATTVVDQGPSGPKVTAASDESQLLYPSTATVNESEMAGHFAGERGEDLGPGKEANFGEAVATTVVDQGSSGPKVTAASDESQLLYPSTATGTAAGERRNLISDQDENIGSQKIALRAMAGTVEEEDPFPPKAKSGTPAAATQLGHPSYPSPTGGGDEVGESPLLSSFEAMAVSDKPKGAEDVLESPVSDKPKGAEGTLESPVSDKPKGAEGTLESPPTVTRDQLSPDKPQQDTPKEGGTEEQKSSSYTEKISSAATAAKDAVVSAVIGSVEYGKMIASTLYGMASDAGTTIMGKIASTVYGMVSVARTTIMGKGMILEGKNDDIKTGQPEKENGVSVAG